MSLTIQNEQQITEVDESDSYLPVIGIPAALGRPSETGYVYQQVGAPYVRALERAGALPLMLPVTLSPSLIRRTLEMVDGILFQGGGDIAPHLYGQEQHPTVSYVNETTDTFELELCRQCLELDIPLLCICRGIQVLNVAMGGTLIQDLPDAGWVDIAHRQSPPRSAPSHPIQVCPGTSLARLLQGARVDVNSFHHQAIDRLAEGLRVAAVTEDGVIEGVEVPDKPFVIGVQFHPEETVDSVPATRELFHGLVEAARSRRKQKQQASSHP